MRKPFHFARFVCYCTAGIVCFLIEIQLSQGQDPVGKIPFDDKFRQMEGEFPTPTERRIASGAPGPQYWQQEVDYVIHVSLDDEKQRVTGSETITYHNHSPHALNYLWLQLDNNIFQPHSSSNLSQTSSANGLGNLSTRTVEQMLAREEFDGGVKITSVKNNQGAPLKYSVVKTMMRIELPQPLPKKETIEFSIDWNYQINNSKQIRARTGCEFFEEDGNYIYEMAHWYPRLACYMDYQGWQHKQFLGRGEFTLEMGDFEVHITVPEDHVVGATGVLQNPKEVLTKKQRNRLKQAKKSEKPRFIITPEEAAKNEASKPKGTKTWIFKAEQVRDFAFATSRKFIWDAMGHDLNGKTVLCMSLYPKEGEPLWSKYSTHAIAHTIDVYSKYTFDYPYPVAISVNGPVYGMEYPMICFNGPRPEKDGTYTARTKYGLISVIIHEVGHNYFPMIVNSDERQWTWMDEGLNTFLQFVTEQEWEEGYPSRRGEPQDIVHYMKSDFQVPVMTNSDSLLQFGPNAYAKPATALNILRETVLGREQFDFAFREYARRWKFKHPTPSDFFRTMEDASGTDLDWFWRGWFYTTDHVDIALDQVELFTLSAGNPEEVKAKKRVENEQQPITLSQSRNKDLRTRLDAYPELADFYNEFDEFEATEKEKKEYEEKVSKLKEEEKVLIKLADRNYYFLTFKNLGGLVMPIILEIEFEDGSKKELRIPAEIWRRNSETVTKMVPTRKLVKQFVVDPHLETADVNLEDNFYPRKLKSSTFEIYQHQKSKTQNEMQKSIEAKKAVDPSDTESEKENKKPE